MLRKISVIAISAAFAACLFGATIGFSEDATPLRVRGALDQVNGNTLTIKTKSGTPVTVQLKDGAPVVAVTKGTMSDVQTNSFVGIASMPQPPALMLYLGNTYPERIISRPFSSSCDHFLI
jgi:hypothetical protein